MPIKPNCIIRDKKCLNRCNALRSFRCRTGKYAMSFVKDDDSYSFLFLISKKDIYIYIYIWWFILINNKLVIIGKNYGFLSKSSINQQPFNEILFIHTHKKKLWLSDRCFFTVYGVSLRFGIGIK